MICAFSIAGRAQTTHLAPAASHAQHAQHPAKSSEPIVRIRIINAKTNKPVTDEWLNVALKVDQVSPVTMPTDKHGIIEVKTGDATVIRILSNLYADCRSRGELYTNYSIAEIHSKGIATGNLCSSARASAKPGELILYEIPKTDIPKYPKPPVSYLPHSDEYPH
ncbi:MAG TPA: hypothetical protein VFE38_12115 [Edaphobacter sp.]|nr:hypothetical protein [Edaphobacter sp.]